MATITTPRELKIYLNKVGMPAECYMMATNHFSWQDLLTKQKQNPGIDQLNNLVKIANLLEYYNSEYLGNKKIIIKTGWIFTISKLISAQESDKYHVDGLALDFIVEHLTPTQIQEILDPVHKEGGMGYHKNYTHIDLGKYTRYEIE